MALNVGAGAEYSVRSATVVIGGIVSSTLLTLSGVAGAVSPAPSGTVVISILRHRDFRHLFLAQMVALVGTGLATVALALLAYDLAGAQAGAVLGTALAIKMTVYVMLAPLSAAIIPPAKRKVALVALDLVRAAVALALPFVTEIWQVYVLIAVSQSASACFTPLFQSLIPEILPDERDYTRALSLSRFAYDLESLLSPAIAAALLTVISFHGLFAGTSIGFVASALLVVTTVFPAVAATHGSGRPYARALRGLRTFAKTPRLRALVALNLCAAAGGAMVFVNTVVVGAQRAAWRRTRSRVGVGGLRRRIDAGGADVAAAARSHAGSPRHACRGRGDGRARWWARPRLWAMSGGALVGRC